MGSDVFADEVARVEVAMQAYEQQKAGLPPLCDMKAPEYLTMKVEDIRKKSPEDLSEAMFQLSQYGFYVQRIINMNRGWERWAKAKIDEAAAATLENLSPNLGYNERELIARHNSPVCKRINQFLRQVRLESDRLYDVPKHISDMVNTIRDIKFAIIRRDKSNAAE